MTLTILRGLTGIAGLIAILWLCSSDRKSINWRLVGGGLLLQLILASCFFVFPKQAEYIIGPVADFFVKVTAFSVDGARMVFGDLVDLEKMGNLFGPSGAFIFAFRVLPTIIFFSALTSVLYYLGVLQRIVFVFAWVIRRLMPISGPEALATAGEVFLGQTESALLVKPYLPTMTRSQIATMMIGGMATIAGGVMAAYISMLGGNDPAATAEFARWLLCASLMNAPAAIIAAKILVPEKEVCGDDLTVPKERAGSNFFDALAAGTSEGLGLALNIGAMLIAFVAFAAFVNWILGGIGGGIPVGGGASLNEWIATASSGVFSSLSLQSIFGTIMVPVAWLMGVEPNQLFAAGNLMGTKLALNEFVAYDQLTKMNAAGLLTGHTVFLCTFALCGFANLSSVGIQLGGIGGLAPNKRAVLASLGLRALIGGTLASILTATIAGVFYQG